MSRRGPDTKDTPEVKGIFDKCLERNLSEALEKELKLGKIEINGQRDGSLEVSKPVVQLADLHGLKLPTLPESKGRRIAVDDLEETLEALSELECSEVPEAEEQCIKITTAASHSLNIYNSDLYEIEENEIEACKIDPHRTPAGKLNTLRKVGTVVGPVGAALRVSGPWAGFVTAAEQVGTTKFKQNARKNMREAQEEARRPSKEADRYWHRDPDATGSDQRNQLGDRLNVANRNSGTLERKLSEVSLGDQIETESGTIVVNAKYFRECRRDQERAGNEHWSAERLYKRLETISAEDLVPWGGNLRSAHKELDEVFKLQTDLAARLGVEIYRDPYPPPPKPLPE